METRHPGSSSNTPTDRLTPFIPSDRQNREIMPTTSSFGSPLRRIRRALALLLAGVAIAAVAACGSDDASSTQREVIDTLRIGVIGSSNVIAGPVGFAHSRGELLEAFAPLGVNNVEVFNFPNGPDLNQALIGGRLDVASYGDTPALVAELARHPDFSLANPNRARSLIGAFGVNQRAFHAKGGAGYRWLADQLIALDALNPQTAAKLLPPLGRWRRFDPTRAALMRAELERIVAHSGLSKDLFEQASKSLEG